MTNKLTGFTASGIALPEIYSGDKWQDKKGDLLPCIYPYSRFIKAFQAVENTHQ
ncbi:hypothetical protein [Arsenophonus sp. PmNCSU2021_1]|uniref:hypothetical protein n=1 Tax=Arsenophonus sp. PmNCSU2021_1 TaxID=3118989 RepID=UPI002FF2D627